MTQPTQRPIVHFNQLQPSAAALLHPGIWRGHSAGVGETQRYDPPDMSIRSTITINRAVAVSKTVLARARAGAFKPEACLTFGPGSIFEIARFAGSAVFFDQDTLLTRGAFDVVPEEFPEVPPQIPQVVGPQPVYLKDERMHYLREPSPLIRVGKGSDAHTVRYTDMENRVSLSAYPRPVGVQAVPDVLQVGDVTHFAMRDGQEMLTRTHNVYVFPQPKA